MSPSFPLDTAQFVALYMQSIFYGMVIITVAYGMRVLLWSREGHLKDMARINWVMVGATIAMFTIATLEMAFGLRHNLEAFVYYTGPGGPNGELSDISNWVNVMRAADYTAQTFIGDGIMLYRCYVVYDRNYKVVVVPALLWLAETACGWLMVYVEATLHTAANMDESRIVPFLTSMLALTLAMTTMTTGLIVYRILKINDGVASQSLTRVGGSRRLTRVVRILIESGLIYTFSVLVFFCTYLASNNAQYGVSDVVVQLIPISFTLILIRVDQGIAIDTSTIQQTSTSIHWNPIKPPVPGSIMLGAEKSQGTTVTITSSLSASNSDSYTMDDMGPGCDRDGWSKARQLDPIV